jgi:hypothetical protein
MVLEMIPADLQTEINNNSTLYTASNKHTNTQNVYCLHIHTVPALLACYRMDLLGFLLCLEMGQTRVMRYAISALLNSLSSTVFIKKMNYPLKYSVLSAL